MRSAFCVLLLSVLASVPTFLQASLCSPTYQLQLKFMNTTTKEGNPATCSDGTPAAYFIGLPGSAPPYNWIIYLDDGNTCNDEDCETFCELSPTDPNSICYGVSEDLSTLLDSAETGLNATVIECYLTRVQCGSGIWRTITSVTPQTILCRDIDYFKSFARVYVPSCTLDWFLGRGNTNNASSSLFRGAYVVDALIETLEALYGLNSSSLVVLAGSRGGGIGAIHSADFIRQKIPGPEIILLVDSSWFIDTEAFAPVQRTPPDIFVVDSELLQQTEDWISNGRLNTACDAVWDVGGGSGQTLRHRCLLLTTLLPYLSAEKIMFLHSQYDLVFLAQLGLIDPTAPQRFFNQESFVLNAISYVESFGSAVRSSTIDAASTAATSHFFFMPACGTHGFIIPTSLHFVPTESYSISNAGTIVVTRDIKTWQTESIAGLAVHNAVGEWITQKGVSAILPPNTSPSAVGEGLSLGVLEDACIGFLCNPTCTESVIPFTVASVFGPCGEYLILTYVLLFLFSLWSGFAWGYYRVKLFRHRARLYWEAFKLGKPLPDFGYHIQMKTALGDFADAGVKEEELNYFKSVRLPNLRIISSARREGPLAPIIASSPMPMDVYKPAHNSIMEDLQSSASVGASGQISSVSPAEEDDEVDLVALAEALTSKDKNVRAAAKKAYKEHQKNLMQRRKDANKTKEELAYAEREREAKRQFEERQKAMGVAAQQAKIAEEEAKKAAKTLEKKKGKDTEPILVASTEDFMGSIEPELSAVLNPVQNSGTNEQVLDSAINANKIQKRAEEELLLEAACLDYRKVHLMVRDMSYWAPAKKSGNPIKRCFSRDGGETRFQILRNIDLAVKPGNVHGLMGQSGSGKSTLLDVLALIRDSGEMRGTHYINGVRSHSNMAVFLRDWLRHNISYVRQTDVLFPRMTVREHLQHAAWLLLPQFMPDTKKLRRVQQVIELLELDSCAETLCGDGGIKFEGGISGGQRRRVSVATQLLRLPAGLLLDEPTSGLDSTNALLLCKSLHTLAHRGGLTIVLTIHQPRNEIFTLFDQLTILANGRIVFSGTPLEAPAHFGIDHSQRQELSVANAILDKLAGAPEDELDQFHSAYSNGPLGRRMGQEMKAEATDFDESMATELQEVLRETALGEGRWSWETPSSPGTQMWVLLSRTMRRGGFDIFKTVLISGFGGCVVGICFVGVNTITSQTALCYLCVATMTILQGAFLGDRYLAEKQMFDHESSAGSAVQWTAFIASQFVRDSVSSASEAVAFGIPVFWVGGMFPNGVRFALFLIMIIILAHVCVSANVAVEIDRNNLRAAALVNVCYIGLGALFNGFIIQVSDLPVYLSWLPYVMITYWGFAGILVNDFAGNRFGCTQSILECATQTGDVVIVEFSFENIDPFVTMLACLLLSILFRTCAVTDFFLRFIRGRGTGLKLVGGGSSLENDNNMNPSFQSNSASSRLGGAMRTMISNRGNAGMRMVIEQKKKNYENTQRVIQAGGGQGLAYNEEWDQVAQEGGKANVFRVAAKEPWYRTLFLTRYILIVAAVLDIGFLGVVCAIPVGGGFTFYIFVVVTFIVAVFFAIQFIVSLCYMVPMTPSGPKDCTWAGVNDVIAFVCTVADLVISIQLCIGNAFAISTSVTQQVGNQETFIVLAGLCRLLRILRVYNFWFKVGNYHEIRAISWLLFAEAEKEKKIEEMRQRQAGGAARGISNTASAFPSAALSAATRNAISVRNMKSVRLASNPMWNSYAATSRGPLPPAINPDSF